MNLADLFGAPLPPPTWRSKLHAAVGVLLTSPEIFLAVCGFLESIVNSVYAAHLAKTPLRVAAPRTRPTGSPPAEASAPPAREPSPVAAPAPSTFPVRTVSDIVTPPVGGLTEVRIPSPVANLDAGYWSAMVVVRSPDLEN